MSDGTKIQWTDASWNPLRAHAPGGAVQKTGWACVRVSQGCVNCYAATINKRLGTGYDYTVPALAKVKPYLDEKALLAPTHWRKPRRIFVCSMTDLFGDWVTDEQIGEVFDVMARTPRHTFQVLTKRPKRMREWVNARRMLPLGQPKLPGGYGWLSTEPWPLPNVWLGTSVEDQAAADERIPELEQTFAAVRFLSCEPLLGPVEIPGVGIGDSAHLDWVIIGGESGPRARPMNLAWARSLVRQSRLACTSVFVKQLGRIVMSSEEHAFNDWAAGNVATFRHDLGAWTLRPKESHGGDPAEWPADLRVREWPSETN